MSLRFHLGASMILTATVAVAVAGAQGRFTSATTETRRVTQTLAREVDALTNRRTDLWFAYRMLAAPGTRQRCGGSHVALEAATGITVMVRLKGGTIESLRTFTPECDVDTGAVPLLWLEGVSADDSASWLTGLIREQTNNREWQGRIGSPALTALALQAGDAAAKSLVAFARDDERTEVRSRALSALGDRAGQQAAAALTSAIDRDPELEVKRTAVRALGRLPKDEGVPLLIQVARTNKTPEIRREAMQRLGQSGDPRAVRFFEEVLTK